MDIAQYLSEKIAQHTDNLHLWENGYLTPTEPDEQERECVMRELKAVISELTFIRTLLPNKHPEKRTWNGMEIAEQHPVKTVLLSTQNSVDSTEISDDIQK